MLGTRGGTKGPVAVLNYFRCRAPFHKVSQLRSSCWVKLRNLILEEGRALKHFEKSTYLDFRIDVVISNLGKLVDELLEIDMREPIRKLLDMLDDLTQDIMIVKLCRLRRWDFVERHVQGEQVTSLL